MTQATLVPDNTLITATPEQGRQLAMKLARLVVLALLALVVPVIKAGILEWLTNSQMGRVAGAAGRASAV